MPCTISDSSVSDFFALASGEGGKPRCGICEGLMEWVDDLKEWRCPEGCGNE